MAFDCLLFRRLLIIWMLKISNMKLKDIDIHVSQYYNLFAADEVWVLMIQNRLL